MFPIGEWYTSELLVPIGVSHCAFGVIDFYLRPCDVIVRSVNEIALKVQDLNWLIVRNRGPWSLAFVVSDGCRFVDREWPLIQTIEVVSS